MRDSLSGTMPIIPRCNPVSPCDNQKCPTNGGFSSYRRHMTVSRRLISLLLVSVYAMAGVAGIAHLEHHHHHKPVVLSERENGSDDAAAAHHGCSCSHHSHAFSPKSCETGVDEHNDHPTCPHEHDDGDCPICQSLAQKPVPIAVVAIVSLPSLVFDRPDDPAITPDMPVPTLPLSRGPPAEV